MKIAHLIKGLGRGGAEGLLPQTIRQRGAGFDYGVGYFLPWKDAHVAELEETGAEVRLFGARSNAALFARVPAVAGWLRRGGFDLVHAHLPLAGVVARFAGRLARVPVVYTEHNLQERYHPLTAHANRLTWGLQRQVVAVSGEVAGSIARRFGARVPVTVVQNGIEIPDLEELSSGRQEVRRNLGIDEAAEVVGAVAVLRSQKRFDLWLEAAREIAASRPAARFLIVGDGPLRSELEALATELELAERIVFAGLQTGVRPYLAAMDLFLISSEFEGLPLALLEAMAARLPVVATRVGGIPEVIETERSGVLVDFGDPHVLAVEVSRLLGDSEARRSLGRAARSRVEAGFSVARMARELEAIYARVVCDGVLRGG